MHLLNNHLFNSPAKMNTVFARSDAVATIYFITQFCAASIRERHLLNSMLLVKSFVNVRALRKSQFYKINEELQYGDLVMKHTFQFLDQSPLCYKAVPTRHLQSVSSFLLPMTSHIDHPPCLKKMLNFSGQHELL